MPTRGVSAPRSAPKTRPTGTAASRCGNINLKPEKSDTLTLGLVLSPGGWAQGMRFSADYYNIKVKDAIGVPFNGLDPVTACFEAQWQLRVAAGTSTATRWSRQPARQFNYDTRRRQDLFPVPRDPVRR